MSVPADPGGPLYLDHNACTPVRPEVLERFLEIERRFPANPGAVHAAGRAARGALEEARREVADALDVDPERVAFVSGGTEANNQALRCFGDASLPVLHAAVEHASVVAAARVRGVVAAGVDRSGRVVWPAPGGLEVGLVAVSHAQSELGTLQPVREAARLASDLGVSLHVDAAQTPGRVPLDEVVPVADSIAFSAHKCGGLRGGTVLVTPDPAGGVEVGPLLHGGGQERGLRSGTPSVALAAAAARALSLAVVAGRDAEHVARLRSVRDAFVEAVSREATGVRCLTPAESLPNTAMLRFENVEGRLLLPALDVAGVEASHGSACSSGSPEPPAVLQEIGLSRDEARQCVRFSFGAEDDLELARRAAARVAACVTRLAAASA